MENGYVDAPTFSATCALGIGGMWQGINVLCQSFIVFNWEFLDGIKISPTLEWLSQCLSMLGIVMNVLSKIQYTQKLRHSRNWFLVHLRDKGCATRSLCSVQFLKDPACQQLSTFAQETWVSPP